MIIFQETHNGDLVLYQRLMFISKSIDTSTSHTPPNPESIWKSYLNTNIREDVFLEAELLLLAFAIAMQDVASFPDYHCFTSNQTGNTVLLAVGVTGIGGPIFEIRNVGISLAMFVAGAWIMGQIGNVVGSRRRWWLLLSSVIQTTLVFAASGLQYRYGTGTIIGKSSTTLGVITLLAFSSGAQVAMVRSMGITDITTAMATAAYIDIFIDKNLFTIHNRPRNRRTIFLIALVAGSFAGVYAYAGVSSAFTLLMSAVVKAVVTVAFLFNFGVREEVGDGEGGEA